ncbi:YgeY family selenium metabolism-linked hydrolase [Clostridium omnivorum]|uniref:Peptidase n=1 Tax=Clostridium omnivorum TaxID=1604902 RepID=A0ABQ5N0R0_9CLOT|nr:YgeY family selenium metabolism-linked hydrolase [Clostridium sp. E14]GLC28767.1 peptidase [Clostridium sp. E14]
MELKNQISELSEKYKDDMVAFLRDMVSIPSTSCNEKKVIERIKYEMDKVGFDEVIIDKMGNIIGRIGSGKTVIAMDAHIDTVDVGDSSLWEVDPFEGELRDGIIYGRGASDQEGGMASMVYAGKIIKELGLTDDYTLYITGTVMEEDCDGLCWQYIIEQDNIKPNYVVITEPTNLNIYRGHRGRMELIVTTKGLSCHGSAPERGVNAIYKMVPIIQGIEKLNENLKEDPFLGKGTVTVTQIFFKSPSQCAVPDECTIQLDRRLTAGETLESAVAEIKAIKGAEDAIVEVLTYAQPSYTGLVYPTDKYYPTWVIDEKHVLIESAVETYKEMFNEEPKVDKWTFSTNGVSIMGRFGIPTIGFGPANEVYAHSPKDQVPVQHLVEACKFYAAFPKTLLNNLK